MRSHRKEEPHAGGATDRRGHTLEELQVGGFTDRR